MIMSSERYGFDGVLTSIEYGYENGLRSFEREVDINKQLAAQDPLAEAEALDSGIIAIAREVAANGAERLSIPGIARADLQYFGDQQQFASFSNFKVHPKWRGNGLGSLLFEEAVDTARTRDCEEFETVAANERTAHLFKGRFDEQDLTFHRLDKINSTLSPLDLSLDGVITFLSLNRLQMPGGPNSNEQLADHIPRVLITTKLK